MSDNEITAPENWPTKAAQEVILELISSGGLQSFMSSQMATSSEKCSQYIIDLHSKLTEYYESLAK